MWDKIKSFFMGLFSKKTTSTPVASPTTIATNMGTPPNASAPSANITLGQITGASEAEKQMIIQAVNYVKRVVYSPEFKTAVMAFSFTSTNSFTNAEIYNIFTQSNLIVNVDDFNGTWTQDHVWHTEGYEVDGDGLVHANRYFIDDSLSMGSLILHELAHMLGFHHTSATEYTSVPYGMNAIFEHVATLLGLKGGLI